MLGEGQTTAQSAESYKLRILHAEVLVTVNVTITEMLLYDNVNYNSSNSGTANISKVQLVD